MQRIADLESLDKERGCVLSIGNFDGVHRGHQAILSALRTHAATLSVPAVVMTFEPHPAALLKPERTPPRLTTPAQKTALIQKNGIDTVIEYPTDWGLLNLAPQEFFDRIVVEKLNAVGLVEGPNFFFGKGRSGSTQTLETFCRDSGRFLELVPPATVGNQIISSSLIRQALQAGNVESAADYLGRPYEISGLIGIGAQRGRTIGFPTANLTEIHTLIPAEGVYAAIAVLQGRRERAAVSIGPNPTFAESQLKVEAHLLEVAGDFYGQEMSLQLIRRIRGLQKFTSIEHLQQQITKDITSVSAALSLPERPGTGLSGIQ